MLEAMRRGGGARAGVIAGIVVVGLLVIFAVGQILLPRLAAREIRDKVARYGEVRGVTVSAVPAIEILWGSIDSAEVDAGSLSITPEQIVRLLIEARSVARLTVTAREIRILNIGLGARPAKLLDARLQKRGDMVNASGVLTDAALRAAMPAGVQASVARASAEGLLMKASGELLGARRSLSGLLHVSEGRLVITPTNRLLASVARLTLFADRRLKLLSLSGRPDGDGAWLLRVSARLR